MDIRTFELEYVTEHFERLIDEAAAGESFVIAQGGRPVALVEPYERHEEVSAGA